jgi:hypothetical protein
VVGYLVVTQDLGTCLGLWTSTNCAITFWRCFGENRVSFPQRHIFGELFPEALILQAYLATPLRVIPSLPLIILEGLSGDSTKLREVY